MSCPAAGAGIGPPIGFRQRLPVARAYPFAQGRGGLCGAPTAGDKAWAAVGHAKGHAGNVASQSLHSVAVIVPVAFRALLWAGAVSQ